MFLISSSLKTPLFLSPKKDGSEEMKRRSPLISKKVSLAKITYVETGLNFSEDQGNRVNYLKVTG